MAATFSFKAEKSSIFGKVYRPVAEVLFRNEKESVWQSVSMLVDTGADYTVLPRFLAKELGIDLKNDCRNIITQGVGGRSRVYLVKEKISVRIGDMRRKVPVGFIDSDYIPPLLGRQEFFETFKVIFESRATTFE